MLILVPLDFISILLRKIERVAFDTVCQYNLSIFLSVYLYLLSMLWINKK